VIRAGRALGVRTGLAVTDQAVSSLSNIALTVVVARAVAPDDFGRYVLVIATFQFVVAVCQAVVSEPFLVLCGGAPDRRSEGGALGTAVLIGSLAAGVLVAVGLLTSATAVVALGLAMPGLLLQDTLRFVAFGQRRPGVALTSDSIWSAGQVLATLWVLAHQGTVAGLVLAWAVPGVASGLCAASILRVWPSLGQVPAWARRSLPFAWRYLGEVMATVGVFQIALYLVGWMVGLAAAGWLRLAQTLFGPVHVAVSAARAAMLPEMVRSLDRPARLAGLRNITAATLIVFTVLWTAGLMVLPRHVGVAAVGVAWLGVAQILGLVGVQKILDASGAGPFLALRALRQARLTLRVRALSGVATLVALPPLTYTWGVRGALVALAFGSGLSCAAWWVSAVRRVRFAEDDGGSGTADEIDGMDLALERSS